MRVEKVYRPRFQGFGTVAHTIGVVRKNLRIFSAALFLFPKGAEMQEERTIVAIGEPSIDALPKETQDYFYTTLLTRITELIQTDKDNTPCHNSESEEVQNELSKS